jgi:hypothetical protein
MALDIGSHFAELTTKTFDDFINTHEFVVVGFVLPWLEDRHERFVTEFSEVSIISRLGRVNVSH